KMPAFEWVHVQLHQQKGMISLSPPTICNSAKFFPSGEPTNSPFIDRFCRRQKDYPLKLHWIVT
ncbi:hypothetical protein AADB85_23735, partial [Escherichia coli]|uniref:hypothetical protein n=1 Tax=Escherichia coli TaxID=562 RepID=UPI0039872C5E